MWIALGLALAASPAPQPARNDDPFEALARAFVTKLAAGDDRGALGLFDAAAQPHLTAQSLGERFDALAVQMGTFQSIVEVRQSAAAPSSGGAHHVGVTCLFRLGKIDLDIVESSRSAVVDFWVRPAGSVAGAADPQAARWSPPPYGPAAAAEERQVTLGEAPWVLPGALVLPRQRSVALPLIVLLGGSGPTDRDSTVGRDKPFKDLAFGLASRGVATLRFDKRTLAHAAAVKAQVGSFTPIDEYADDTQAALVVALATPEIDPRRIFLAGHSMGGQLGPRLVAADSRWAGLIVLEGPTQPLGEELLRQHEALLARAGEIDGASQAELDTTRNAALALADPALAPDAGLKLFGVPLSLAYARAWAAERPVETARHLHRPILIVQGAKDVQVDLTDYNGWVLGLADVPQVAYRLFAKTNHLLMSEGASAGTTVGHVDPAIVEALAAFVREPPRD